MSALELLMVVACLAIWHNHQMAPKVRWRVVSCTRYLLFAAVIIFIWEIIAFYNNSNPSITDRASFLAFIDKPTILAALQARSASSNTYAANNLHEHSLQLNCNSEGGVNTEYLPRSASNCRTRNRNCQLAPVAKPNPGLIKLSTRTHEWSLRMVRGKACQADWCPRRRLILV